MEHTLKRYGTFALIAVAMCLTILAIMILSSRNVSASAPSGLVATVATSTSLAVSTTASTLIATSTCTARIITSRAQPLMLTFSDYNGATPTAMFGHLQPASTTVAYDSGIYGCGLVKAYAYGADTITVTETR